MNNSIGCPAFSRRHHAKRADSAISTASPRNRRSRYRSPRHWAESRGDLNNEFGPGQQDHETANPLQVQKSVNIPGVMRFCSATLGYRRDGFTEQRGDVTCDFGSPQAESDLISVRLPIIFRGTVEQRPVCRVPVIRRGARRPRNRSPPPPLPPAGDHHHAVVQACTAYWRRGAVAHLQGLAPRPGAAPDAGKGDAEHRTSRYRGIAIARIA